MDTSSQLEAALDELERVQAQAAATQAKVSRLRKVLKLAEERAGRKTLCLSKELAQEDDEREQSGNLSDGERMDVENSKILHQISTLSPGEINFSLGEPGPNAATV